MGNMIKGILVGMAAGAALGIAFDPLTAREKRMMMRKAEKMMDIFKQ